MKEFNGQIMLHGKFDTAFTAGTNETILPTETQKNTMYALSKKYPVDPLERWVVLAARDVMSRHAQISAVDMDFSRLPWTRVTVDGRPHNHAFVRGSEGTRFVRARIPRDGAPSIVSGLKGLRVMKTTQSGFEGFAYDPYTTLKPTKDRILATEISYEYAFVEGISLDSTPFSDIAAQVHKMTIERFAGNPEEGIYSPSVQQTIYDIATAVLKKFQVIKSMKFALPNIHFYLVDFKDFKESNLVNNGEVFLTFDGAHGQIEAEVVRPKAKL